LDVVFVKRALGREPLVVCAGPPGARVYLDWGWTDLGPAPAAGCVSVESLAALVEATRRVRALDGKAGGDNDLV
jgi:hypothetical protein